MFIQLKTGYALDHGPSWIGWVDFNRSFKTARYRGRTLRRWTGGLDANIFDIETDEEYWLSGPKRDRTDTRYGPAKTAVDDDARDAYESFLSGSALPGRESG
ncbi:hypothetical protein [Demequina sp. SO4-13]|uniref:hypothetical protein n=1 Tax=Demequina sp. SO4-13 TaxID=3401027 RepID=UPI003AF5D823